MKILLKKASILTFAIECVIVKLELCALNLLFEGKKYQTLISLKWCKLALTKYIGWSFVDFHMSSNGLVKKNYARDLDLFLKNTNLKLNMSEMVRSNAKMHAFYRCWYLPSNGFIAKNYTPCSWLTFVVKKFEKLIYLKWCDLRNTISNDFYRFWYLPINDTYESDIYLLFQGKTIWNVNISETQSYHKIVRWF